MTVKEFIKQEQNKHPNKEIGDAIALQIMDKKYNELYFEDCNICEGEIEELEDRQVSEHYYLKNYGNLKDKLKLTLILGGV